MFGNEKIGYMFYDEDTTHIRCSNLVYMETELVKYMLNALHFTWASFEGQAETYNVFNLKKCNLKVVKEFFKENPKFKDQVNSEAEESIAGDEPKMKTKWHCHELSRKNISSAVWT